MAVVQLRNGIYVNSTETVPDADQTAAYKYASIFTKSRKENWEMSQRQAASEIADAKVRDAAAIKRYDAQIANYNDRLKQLDEDIARTGTDVAKANAATQRTALQEATSRQQNEIEFAKAKAEGVVVSGGSRSSSTSSGTSASSGGGGGGGGGSSAQKSADDLVNVEIGNQGDGARDPSALQDGLKRGALNSANISNTDPNVVAAAKAGGVAASVGILATDYRNAGYSESDALAAAEADVLQDLTDNNHLDAVDAYNNKQAVDLAGGGGRTSTSERSSRSSSVRDPGTLQPRYQGLPDNMPAATVIDPPTVKVDTADLTKARGDLAKELADLLGRGAPASEVDDFITRSREIMAGRFGSPQVSPNYYRRNASQNISGMSDADAQALLTKFRSSAEGAPVRITPTTPIAPTTTTALRDTDPLTGLVYDTSYGESGGAGTSEPLGSLKTSRPGTPGFLIPTVTEGGSGGGPGPEQLPGLQTSRRIPPPSGGGSGGGGGGVDTRLMSGPTSTGYTVTEGGSGGGPGPESLPGLQTSVPRLNNFPNRMDELRSLFPDGVPQEVLDAAANMQTSNPPPVSRPQMQNPGGTIGTVGPFMPGFGDPTPNIGSKPEAIGDFNIPDMPGAYNNRPFDPASNPYGGDFAPNKDYPPVPGEGGARFETTYESDGLVPMSDLERQQIIRLKEKAREENKRKQREIDDAKKAKPSGKTGYFQQRFDNAKEIVDQPGKLARLTASGPGKVAADVYNANKTTDKDFKLTYDTLTATYEDDKEALAVAHQVALALDIANRARTAPPKA